MNTIALGFKFSVVVASPPILLNAETQSTKDVLALAAWVMCCQRSEGVVGRDRDNGGVGVLFRELPNYPAYRFAGSFPLLFPLINQTSFSCY